METLSLSLAWTESIRQWTWIVKQLDEDSTLSIEGLKYRWMSLNDYPVNAVKYNCFLCEYVVQNLSLKNFCTNCPAILTDSNLKRCWCQEKQYNWSNKPKAFLAKLKEVYAVWLT